MQIVLSRPHLLKVILPATNCMNPGPQQPGAASVWSFKQNIESLPLENSYLFPHPHEKSQNIFLLFLRAQKFAQWTNSVHLYCEFRFLQGNLLWAHVLQTSCSLSVQLHESHKWKHQNASHEWVEKLWSSFTTRGKTTFLWSSAKCRARAPRNHS